MSIDFYLSPVNCILIDANPQLSLIDCSVMAECYTLDSVSCISTYH
jgi:hypothetical protein